MSDQTSPQRRAIQDQFQGCLDYTAETWILRLQARAWLEGAQAGWKATSDRVHYNMPTGYRDLPRHVRTGNPYKED